MARPGHYEANASVAHLFVLIFGYTFLKGEKMFHTDTVSLAYDLLPALLYGVFATQHSEPIIRERPVAVIVLRREYEIRAVESLDPRLGSVPHFFFVQDGFHLMLERVTRTRLPSLQNALRFIQKIFRVLEPLPYDLREFHELHATEDSILALVPPQQSFVNGHFGVRC